MTMPSQADVVVTPQVAVTAVDDRGSYVDWPAVIAGIAIASAISIVLLGFGSAIGLSFVDFRAGNDVNPFWIAMAAALWLLWVQVSSFMAGAYATGRLRKRHNDATEDEVDVRDGAHGLLVWAGALVIGALIAAGGIGAVANAVGSAAATVTNAVSNVADDASSAIDPTAYYADWLLRPAPPAEGAAPAAPAADTAAARGEAGRILAQATIAGSVGDTDRAYLGQLVAANTGLPPDQATARVDEVMAAIDQAKAQAAEAAEAARKTAVLGAFLTAASFLVSAVGAFWAAQKGGRHRDENTVFTGLFRRL
jgi:hypothetical protein